jgi:hypothetical protein
MEAEQRGHELADSEVAGRSEQDEVAGVGNKITHDSDISNRNARLRIEERLIGLSEAASGSESARRIRGEGAAPTTVGLAQRFPT